MNKSTHPKIMRFILIAFCIIHTITGLDAQTDTMWLDQGWRIRSADNAVEIAAKVPGYVPVDMAAAGLLPDIFSRDFEAAALDVCHQIWVYETTFHLDSAHLSAWELILLLKSVDTYADVSINGRWAGRCGNMFTPFSFDIKPLVVAGRNSISIQFLPVTQIAAEQYDEQGDSLPEGPRVMARKAQYMFGWDWAPTIPAAGISQKIGLLVRGQTFATIDRLNVGLSADLRDGYIKSSCVLQSHTGGTFFTEIKLDGKLIKRVEHSCKNGKNELQWEVAVKNPEKWWPQPYGEAKRYELEVRLLNADNQTILNHKRKIGFRHVSLVQEKDKRGSSFAFHINGKPIFMKGANWIPLHFFPTEASDEDYTQSLQQAQKAHINMLRVWGGGIYERDLFYELCDSLGIMVWQDFMFACAMYPDNPGFLASVEREAAYQLHRLSPHACIALWCGNNEVAEGWSNWGWKSGRSAENVAKIQKAYDVLFREILPQQVSAVHPEIAYWESSPSYGRGSKPYLTEGDAHDWYVWHDGYPFSHFLENIPRFMSEFGFQSYPAPSTMEKFAGKPGPEVLPEDHWKMYQKHARGAKIIREYLARDYPAPTTLEEWVYLSQLMQARGISDAILAHRKAEPYCMGSLFWQWNDCWPAVSWSANDFLAQPKALYYYAKRAFRPTVMQLNASGKLHLVSDLPFNEPIEWNIYAGNESGDMKTLKTGKTKSNSTLKKRIQIHGNKKTTPWVALDYSMDQQDITQIIVPDGLRTWRVVQNELNVKIEPAMEGFSVTIKAKTPLIGCMVDYPGLIEPLEDNFVDILPGQQYRWHIKTGQLDPKQLKVMALSPPR
jgi:beta-mannosidase